MIPALTLSELEKKVNEKYQFGEKRIIGIMLARYDISLVKSVIGECYQYWNYNSDKQFDIFWPGYGEYLPPDMECNNKKILTFQENSHRVYFDMKEFINIKKELNSFKKFIYRDKFELLLVNYYDGHIHYNEYISIDLEKNLDEYYGSIRELIELVTTECGSKSDVVSLHKKLLAEDIKKSIQGIKVSEFVSAITGVISVI